MDIIVLIFLCFRIKNIVKPKGYNSTQWVVRTVLLWILAEMSGFCISLFLQKDMLVGFLSGWLCAVASYLYIRNKALNLPDLTKEKDWKDFFEQDQ